MHPGECAKQSPGAFVTQLLLFHKNSPPWQPLVSPCPLSLHSDPFSGLQFCAFLFTESSLPTRSLLHPTARPGIHGLAFLEFPFPGAQIPAPELRQSSKISAILRGKKKRFGLKYPVYLSMLRFQAAETINALGNSS